jgi:hypothetical protein
MDAFRDECPSGAAPLIVAGSAGAHDDAAHRIFLQVGDVGASRL